MVMVNEAAGLAPTAPFLLRDRLAEPAVSPRSPDTFPLSKANLRLRLYTTLLASDLLLVTLSFLLAGNARQGAPLEEQTLRTLAIILPTFIPMAFNNGAYSTEVLSNPSRGVRRVVEAFAYAAAIAITLLFLLKVSADFSRLIFAIGSVLSLIFVVSGRLAIGSYIGRKHNWSFANELVIADGISVKASKGQVVLNADELASEPRLDDPIFLDRLSHYLARCDRVVIACAPERRSLWSHLLKGTCVNVEVCIPELSTVGAIGLSNFGDQKTLVVSCGPLSMRARILKRAIDLVLATATLIFLAPVMLLVAIAIKIESPGPVLFKQLRVGQNNQLFRVLKFRSMRVECTDATGLQSASRTDARLTRVGAFIRRTSIDELPQLFNVLAGTMSVVGPRPHALGSRADNDFFWHIDERYFDRHSIKPGITGLAQVRGFRGATMKRDDLTNRLQCDLEYVAGWTAWRDIKIIAATFAVLVHQNAF